MKKIKAKNIGVSACCSDWLFLLLPYFLLFISHHARECVCSHLECVIGLAKIHVHVKISSHAHISMLSSESCQKNVQLSRVDKSEDEEGVNLHQLPSHYG